MKSKNGSPPSSRVVIKDVAYLANQMSHQKSKFIFWLGAGVSVTAGIPAGAGIVDRLLDLSWRDSQPSPSGPQSVEPFASLSEASRTERSKVVREWAIKNLSGIGASTHSKGTRKPSTDKIDWGTHYSTCLALLPGEQVRQKFIVECIKEGKGNLNLAHLLMAQLMINGFVRIALTTNFDDLLLRALQLYFEIPSVDPEQHSAFTEWGNILQKQGRDEEAIEKYRAATEIYPDSALDFLKWGNVLAKLRRDEEAIEKYRRATDINPQYAQALVVWGQALRRLHRSGEAIEKYRQATEINPDYAAAFAFWGDILQELNRNEEAIEKFRRATEIEPNLWAVFGRWGDILRMLGRDEEAIAIYEQAIKFNPKRAPLHASLAAAYRKLNRQSEYAREIQIATDSIAGETEYNRACFESVRGNVEESLALLKTVIDKKLQPLTWIRRDPDLDFIRDDPRFKALVQSQ